LGEPITVLSRGWRASIGHPLRPSHAKSSKANGEQNECTSTDPSERIERQEGEHCREDKAALWLNQ
jgi:hypothetical protein